MSFIAVCVQVEIPEIVDNGSPTIGYDALAAFKVDENLPYKEMVIATIDDYRRRYSDKIFKLIEADILDTYDYVEDPEHTPGLDIESEIRRSLK